MKASEIRQKTDEEIAKQLNDSRAKIFQLRLKVQTNELKNTAEIGALRKDIARLNTEINARAAKAAANN
jgi:large subunit ribosomal protein L29